MEMQSFRLYGAGLMMVAIMSGAICETAKASEARQIDHSVASEHANIVLQKQALLQSMTRDACFKMAGVTGKDFGNRAAHAVQSMEASFAQLRSGEQGTVNSALVRARFGGIQRQWDDLGAALQQVSAGDYHTVALGQILSIEPQMHKDLGALHQTYVENNRSDARKDGVLAKTTKVHKMVKEACFVMRDISAAENRRQIKETINAFELSIVRANVFLDSTEIDRLHQVWTPLNTLLSEVLSSDHVADQTKIRLSQLSDTLIEVLVSLQVRSTETQIAPFTGFSS